jgi:hypothetical protein
MRGSERALAAGTCALIGEQPPHVLYAHFLLSHENFRKSVCG